MVKKMNWLVFWLNLIEVIAYNVNLEMSSTIQLRNNAFINSSSPVIKDAPAYFGFKFDTEEKGKSEM